MSALVLETLGTKQNASGPHECWAASRAAALDSRAPIRRAFSGIGARGADKASRDLSAIESAAAHTDLQRPGLAGVR